MSNSTAAGRLLESLRTESPDVCDAITSAAGLSADRALAAMAGTLRLSLSEQLRLSEAAAVLAPDFTSHALRLRAHVLSARSVYTNENVAPDRRLLNDVWDRTGELQR